jgi:murein DD-endopeptidase MepM/ murein hydrolase activator NlpD
VLRTLLALLLTAAACAASARADTVTTESTSTAAGTTATATATTTTTTTTATAAPTTQAVAPTTTAAPATAGTTAPAAAATPVTTEPFSSGCPVGAVAVLLPHRTPLAVGPLAATPDTTAALSLLAYPANGSVVTASSVSVAQGGCSGDATAQVAALSLFGGAVTASSVELRVGPTPVAAVSGLAVAGRSTAATAGAHIPVQQWGYVVADASVPVAPPGREIVGGLAVHLLRPHAGLPAGTVVVVSAAGRAAPAQAAARERRATRPHPRRRKPRPDVPLTVTPPLGVHHLDFPVAGPAQFGDSYGGFRGDVAGNWHHGDDIFAPLGTPVVAVASGTVNRVGWEALGGWRLWVRDSVGDEFYYAHLSGYAPAVLRSPRVTRGEVIGFVGNTGDAFTTQPHLHFEIHPRPLLHLGYGGAVDPTTYLDSWPHLAHVAAPRPVHPPLPVEPPLRREATFVFRELLAARHLLPRGVRVAPPPGPLPPSATVRRALPPAGAAAAAAAPSARRSSPLLAAGVTAGGLLLLVLLLVAPLRPRRRPTAPSAGDAAQVG